MTETTTITETVPRGPVTTQLTFYAPPPDNAQPYNYVQTPPPDTPQRNYQDATHSITLTDIRNNEPAYTLDKAAIQPLQNIPTTTTPATFTDDNAVTNHYYPEVESLLLTHVPGAHKVVIFDHTIRREGASNTGPASRIPVHRAHVDQTLRAAAERVKLHVPDPNEAESLLRGRFRIINVWKSLDESGPVLSEPLAFADAASVDAEDLVPVEHRYPTRTGETLGVRFNERQRWLYWSGMVGSERLLLKCADSWGGRVVDDGVEVRSSAPHSAFSDPRTAPGAKGRESIEVRALVFG